MSDHYTEELFADRVYYVIERTWHPESRGFSYRRTMATLDSDLAFDMARERQSLAELSVHTDVSYTVESDILMTRKSVTEVFGIQLGGQR